MRSKIRSFNPLEPDDSWLETLRQTVSALERGFKVNSPLQFSLRTTVELLARLASVIQDIILNQLDLDPEKDPEVPLEEDAFEISPIIGKQLHRNWFDNSLSWIPDPLIDERDETIILDPITGEKNVILSSNPKYRKRRIKSKRLQNPEEAIESLLQMAETLTSMARGEVWKPFSFVPKRGDRDSPRSPTPEGRSLSRQQYWFWRRRRSSRLKAGRDRK